MSNLLITDADVIKDLKEKLENAKKIEEEHLAMFEGEEKKKNDLQVIYAGHYQSGNISRRWGGCC